MRNINKDVNKNIPVIFQNLEQFEKGDSRFVKVKIWLMHLGKNLNNSVFTKESTLKAIGSLANTPILSFIEENSNGEIDYSDHRSVVYRKDDGEVGIKYMGQAIGLIPETNNAKFEMRVSDSGEELEYLTVEGLLWTKWDDPIDIIQRKEITSQSMELSDNHSGYWNEEGSYVFENFQFFGACLLGDGVAPAMKNSTAELQFSANGDMQKIITNKLEEFNTLFSKDKTIDEEKGGKSVPEQLEFALTQQQLATKLRSVVGMEKTKYEDDDDYEFSKYWYVDHTATEVIFEAIEEGWQLYQAGFTVNEDAVAVDLENKVKAKVEYVPEKGMTAQEFITKEKELKDAQDKVAEFEQEKEAMIKDSEATKEAHTTELAEANGKIEEFEKQIKDQEENFNKQLADKDEVLATKTSEFEAQVEELESLRKFKKDTELFSIKEKFSGKLEEDILDSVVEANADKELSEIEGLLFAEIGKQNFSQKKEEKQFSYNGIHKEEPKHEDKPSAFNGLFERFGKQNQ